MLGNKVNTKYFLKPFFNLNIYNLGGRKHIYSKKKVYVSYIGCLERIIYVFRNTTSDPKN